MLSEIQGKEGILEIFLNDGRKAFGKMLTAQEKRAAEKKGGRE